MGGFGATATLRASTTTTTSNGVRMVSESSVRRVLQGLDDGAVSGHGQLDISASSIVMSADSVRVNGSQSVSGSLNVTGQAVVGTFSAVAMPFVVNILFVVRQSVSVRAHRLSRF
mgnify:CR=1 FL=1